MELEDDEDEDAYDGNIPYQLDDRWRPGDEALPGNRPRGWMTAAQVVAWVVWRENVTEFDWQTAFYPGAEEWLRPGIPFSTLMQLASGAQPFASSEEFPAWLREAFDRLGSSNGRFAFGMPVRGTRGMMDAPEVWPAAAQNLYEWMKGEWVPDPRWVGILRRPQEENGTDPDQSLDAQKIWGLDGGYARCRRNFDYFWKGAEVLRRTLAMGQLAAFGREVPARAPGRIRIPADVFAAPVAICVSELLPCTSEEARQAETRPSPIWTDLLLDAEAVVGVWPEYVAPAEVDGIAAAPEIAGGTAADTWMAEKARGRKYDDAIATCMKETGATNRAARAAWARLPGAVRGKRGPQRSS